MTDAGIEYIIQEAQSAYHCGEYILACEAYARAIDIVPDNPGLLNSYGITLTDLGNFDEAYDAFRKAIALDDAAPELWMNLAKAQRLAKDEAGEAHSLAAALSLDQRHFMARVRQAELHERQGNKSLALHDWNAVLQLSAGLDACNTGLADILSHAKNYAEQSSAEFEAAIVPALKTAGTNISKEAKRRFDALIGVATGKRAIYHNECAGLHFPFLPADEFFDRSHFPWMEQLEAMSEAVKAELVALFNSGGEGFAPYVSMPSGVPENKWSKLNDSNRWDACYLVKYGVVQAEAASRCPNTMAALEAIPRFDVDGRGPTIFFSLLRPNTHIPAHTGVSNTRSIIHLPLIVPADCTFRVGGETREWQFGEAFGFDDTIEHEAWNKSNDLRAVLIFDVWNPYLTADELTLLRAFYNAADNSGLNPLSVHDI